MPRRTLRALAAALACLTATAACASGPKAAPAPPAQPGDAGYQAPVPAANAQLVRDLPKWFLDPPRDPNFIIEPATEVSRDLQAALDRAFNAGRFRIAQQLEVQMAALGKRFQEETGAAAGGAAAGTSEFVDQWSQAVKTTVQQSLTGSRAREQIVKPEGAGFRAYVLMEMPLGRANQTLLNQIREQQSLYTRLRATQAFKDLEGEVAKYEKPAAAASTP